MTILKTPIRLGTIVLCLLSMTTPVVHGLAPRRPFSPRRSFLSDLTRPDSKPPAEESPLLNTAQLAELPVKPLVQHQQQTRRQALHTTTATWMGAFCGWILEPRLRHATAKRAFAAYLASNDTTTASADSVRVFVQGTVTLPPNYQPPEPPRSLDETVPFTQPMTPPALYITCRPNTLDDIPRAILDGSRGKAPPVLTARYENPTFPFVFQLTSKDVTLEGQKQGDSYWWANSDLIVSARFDMDGVAATRGPDDLVGRTNCVKATDKAVELELVGRGAFGKFATTRK